MARDRILGNRSMKGGLKLYGPRSQYQSMPLIKQRKSPIFKVSIYHEDDALQRIKRSGSAENYVRERGDRHGHYWKTIAFPIVFL